MLTRKEADEIKYQLHSLADMYMRASTSKALCMKAQAQIRASNLIASYNTITVLIGATFNSDIIPSTLTTEVLDNANVDAQKLFESMNINCAACNMFNGCMKGDKRKHYDKYLQPVTVNTSSLLEVSHA